MQTLYDFGLEVQKIREAINDISVKGVENASLVVFAVKKCTDVIQAINDVIKQQQNPPTSQNEDEFYETEENEVEEEGEMNGESDSGTAP